MTLKATVTRALAAREAAGRESWPVAAAYQVLATIYEAKSNTSWQKSFRRKAITLREKVLGPNHFEVANSYNNLGLVLMNTERVDEAEQAYLKALSIFDKSVDPEHPFAAMTLANLATINLRRGNWDKAAPFAERVCTFRKNCLDPIILT